MKTLAFRITSLLLVTTLASCTLYFDEQAPPQNEMHNNTENHVENAVSSLNYEYQPGVMPFTPNILNHLVAVQADTVLFFMDTTPANLLPQQGQLVSCGVADKLPNGINGKVEKLVKSAGMWQCTMRRLPLKQIFKKLNIEFHGAPAWSPTPQTAPMTATRAGDEKDKDGKKEDEKKEEAKPFEKNIFVRGFDLELGAKDGQDFTAKCKFYKEDKPQGKEKKTESKEKKPKVNSETQKKLTNAGFYLRMKAQNKETIHLSYESESNRLSCYIEEQSILQFEQQVKKGTTTLFNDSIDLMPNETDENKVTLFEWPIKVQLTYGLKPKLGIKFNAAGNISAKLASNRRLGFAYADNKFQTINEGGRQDKDSPITQVDFNGNVTTDVGITGLLGLSFGDNVSCGIEADAKTGVEVQMKHFQEDGTLMVNDSNYVRAFMDLSGKANAALKAFGISKAFEKKLGQMNVFSKKWLFFPTLTDFVVHPKENSKEPTFEASFTLKPGLFSKAGVKLHPFLRVYHGGKQQAEVRPTSTPQTLDKQDATFNFVVEGLDKDKEYEMIAGIRVGNDGVRYIFDRKTFAQKSTWIGKNINIALKNFVQLYGGDKLDSLSKLPHEYVFMVESAIKGNTPIKEWGVNLEITNDKGKTLARQKYKATKSALNKTFALRFNIRSTFATDCKVKITPYAIQEDDKEVKFATAEYELKAKSDNKLDEAKKADMVFGK